MSSAREVQRRDIAEQIYNKNAALRLVSTVRNPFKRKEVLSLIRFALEDDSDAIFGDVPQGYNQFENAEREACNIIARRSRAGETYGEFIDRVTKPSLTSRVLGKIVEKAVCVAGVVVDAAIPLGSVRTKD